MRRCLLVTDARAPQTNGVVTTLSAVVPGLPAYGWEATVVHPGGFRTAPLPLSFLLHHFLKRHSRPHPFPGPGRDGILAHRLPESS